MSKIDISFCAPSIRPHLWKTFCDSLANTKASWEAIFVGPLPPNFKWIKSHVKPSQCTHIAFMEAQGEFISLTADDAQYFSPDKTSSTDNMLGYIRNYPWADDFSYHYAFGFRMFEDNFAVETSLTHKLNFVNDTTSPLLYPFFVVRKETYLKLHGYDTRFVCGQAENDFLLRVAFNYGHTANSLAPRAMVWANHDEGHNNQSKFREYHPYETELLKKLWLHNNTFTTMRQYPLEEYVNDGTIRVISQGVAGEWTANVSV